MNLLALAAYASAFTATDIRNIRAECRAPRTWLSMQRDGSVRITPPRNADVKKVDCILARIKALSIERGAFPNMGFVGNVAPE